jgi:hypothetical protein
MRAIEEESMHGKCCRKILWSMCVLSVSLCICAGNGHAQESAKLAPSSETPTDVSALSELIRDLQTQVQALNAQLSDLRTQQLRASEETRELRRELDLVKAQTPPVKYGAAKPALAKSTQPSPELPASPATLAQPQEPSTPDRLARLEEDQAVLEGKLNDQYLSKIESGSKYRIRLSGIALMNVYENRGNVESQDLPQLVEPSSPMPLFPTNVFGGSLRQSQFRLQAFGPDIAGARTSADVTFDFAGGFPDAPNGATMGLVRLRTGIMRLDWANTSLIAGQDTLFFAPLAPTSLATIATPALAYAGNLWAWAPQVRIEHRFALSDVSDFSIQGGFLDSLTGDFPRGAYARDPSWGEASGQPTFAARIAWSHRAFGENLTLGAGGYYERQSWGFTRTIDGWGGMLDATVPLGKRFEFTGAFYRARGAGGFGGGIGQTVLLNGSFINPATTFRGLDSMGGWAQLKYKLKPNFEINGALGIDNPFAGELRQYSVNTIYEDTYTRNLNPMVNFIYQIRSDILISTEYRWLNTSVLDAGSNSASHINLSLGYLF